MILMTYQEALQVLSTLAKKASRTPEEESLIKKAMEIVKRGVLAT